MALPTMTQAQREAAQAKSLEVRRARKELLDGVKAGRVTVAQVVAQGQDEDDPAARLRVLVLVKALPKVGEVKAKALLASAGVAENKRVNGLGKRQQEALVAAVADVG